MDKRRPSRENLLNGSFEIIFKMCYLFLTQKGPEKQSAIPQFKVKE